MEARTTAARAEYKGLLWGKGSWICLLSFPTALGFTLKKRIQRRKRQQPAEDLRNESLFYLI